MEGQQARMRCSDFCFAELAQLVKNIMIVALAIDNVPSRGLGLDRDRVRRARVDGVRGRGFQRRRRALVVGLRPTRAYCWPEGRITKCKNGLDGQT